MEITDIRITLHGDERLKAFANVIFDDAFIVRGLKVIHGPQGLFVSMPSRVRADGTYQDICHPIKSPMREYMEKTILSGYEKAAATMPSATIQVSHHESGSEFNLARKDVGG